MSGSGGFFKYRCKYFYTHDCPNWVFVNYAPCAECCAAGRDDPDGDDALPARQVLLFQLGATAAGAGAAPARPGLDIAVPVFRDGVLHYARTHVAVHAVPGAPFVAWQFPESSGGYGDGGSNGGGGHAVVAPSPHQPLLHQHAALPYGGHDYVVDGNDGADNTHHYNMHGDRDDDHLRAQHQPRPSPPAHHVHPHSPRWQQQQHQQQQQPLHGDDEYNGLPPPYPGHFGSYAGLRY